MPQALVGVFPVAEGVEFQSDIEIQPRTDEHDQHDRAPDEVVQGRQ